MSKACKTCKGKGRWEEVDITSSQPIAFEDGRIAVEEEFHTLWHECNDCKGTGIDQDPEAGDDFDIGGDSFEDD